jgi:BASS family bile acid:Na+ symporter
MSSIGNVLSFASVPLVVALALDAFGGAATPVSMSFGEMATTLFATTATPVLLGMALLHFRPALAARIERPLLNVATTALCMLIVGLGVGVSQSSDDLSLTALFARMTGPVVLLVASGMGLGVLAARALRLGGAAARTIALEIGIQNVNLALVVAMTLLHEQRYSGPALVYLPVMFVFAGAVVAAGRRAEPSRVAAVGG